MRTLAMTAGRRAQYARIARTRFDRHEAELGPAVKRAIDQYLALLRAKLDSAAGERLVAAAAPHPGDKSVDKFTDEHAEAMVQFLDESDEWQPILNAEIMPTYKRVLDEVLQAGLNDPAISGGLTNWRDQWLADRTQVLVGVPDQITSQLRTALGDQAQLAGTNVNDARTVAQEMLDNGYPSWQGRADLIARTETVGANNQGSLASWSALSESSGVTATKTWLATGDASTRPDHAEADGQTVSIDDVFDVGGESMNGPGDPDADPSNVCNCRCTMTYDFPDGSGGDEGISSGDDGSSGGSLDDLSGLTDDLDLGAMDEAAYRSMDDGALSAALGAAVTDTEVDRIVAELDRRDTLEKAAAKRAAKRDAANLAKDQAFDARLAAGDDAESAYADVYGKSIEQQRRDTAIAAMRSNGYQGVNFDALASAAWRDFVTEQRWDAEEATKGAFFKGTTNANETRDVMRLFTGSEAYARKNASDELLEYWQKHGRVTLGDFKASMLSQTIQSKGTASWL